MSIQRHSFYNLVGSLAPIAVTLFTVPLYLRLIGIERYGVLVIVWIFLGYFGVFDLGLGRATAQRIATLRQAESYERAETFWTVLILNTTFGIVGGLLLWPAAQYFFTTHFQVTEVLRLEVVATVPWMAAAVPVATTSGVLIGALHGREQFLALNASDMLGTVLFQLFPLGVAWFHGPDLAWLVPAALLGRVAVFVVLFAQCYHHVPLNVTPSVSRTLVAPLFRYGGWVTVTGFIGPLLSMADRFMIGSIAGAKAVTYYTVPYNLASRVTALPQSLSSALFPRFSATSDEDRDRLMDEAVLALSVIMTPLIIAGIIIMDPFVKWWVGPDLARNSAYVGEIIALGLWFNGLACIPFARLQAQGRPDLCAKCHLIEVIPYIVFLMLALRTWGVAGAALAGSLRVTVDAVLLFWVSGVAPRRVLVHLPPLLLLVLAAAAIFGFPPGSVSRWAVGAIALLGSLAWACRVAPDSVKILVRKGYQLLSRTRNT